MFYVYPCVLTPEEGGGFYVTFPDVPGALTSGKDRLEALAMAEDALTAALAGYVQERWDIPVPSAVVHGQELVAVAPVVAAKLALYTAMRRQDITKTALAKCLGLSEAAVRKLVDPDHRSHISSIEAALQAVGRSLVIGDRVAHEPALKPAAVMEAEVYDEKQITQWDKDDQITGTERNLIRKSLQA